MDIKKSQFPFDLDFFEIFVHDLKSPLSVLKYQIDTIQDKKLKETLKVHLSQVLQFIDDGLHIKELDEHNQFKFEKYSWNKILKESLEKLSSKISISNVQVHWTPLKPDIYVSVDPKWFRRALSQLILNSIEHSPKEGTIFLKTSKDFLFSITDQGKGLPKDIQPKKIFKKFQSFRTQGTGLGLFIAQRIVQAHGGHIQVESSPKGCKFFFSLPQKEDIQKAS